MRLSQWVEDNNSLVDDQNDLLKGRITIDQISSLTCLLDVWKKTMKLKLLRIIDFNKAYDAINRTLVWAKPTSLGDDVNMCTAIISFYTGGRFSIQVNSFNKDWFTVAMYLKSFDFDVNSVGG